jgi:hypothetical protein
MGLQGAVVGVASDEDDAMARLLPCHREQSLIVTLSGRCPDDPGPRGRDVRDGALRRG